MSNSFSNKYKGGAYDMKEEYVYDWNSKVLWKIVVFCMKFDKLCVLIHIEKQYTISVLVRLVKMVIIL